MLTNVAPLTAGIAPLVDPKRPHNYRLHVWVLLGKQNTRKGSTIRALTGVALARDFEVMLINGQSLRFWSQTQSVNEPQDGEEPAGFVESCFPAEPGRKNILVPVRLDVGVPGYEAEDYLKAFLEAGAFVESIVTLGEKTRSGVADLGAPFADIIDVAGATNAVAEQLRALWGWR